MAAIAALNAMETDLGVSKITVAVHQMNKTFVSPKDAVVGGVRLPMALFLGVKAFIAELSSDITEALLSTSGF